MKTIYVLPFLLLIVSCKKNADTSPGPSVLTVSKDCIPGSPGCSELVVQGDAYYTPPSGPVTFSGYADPGLRKDPLVNTLYLTYSWPNVTTINGHTVGAVDVHLAKSIDGGNSWSLIKTLWPSVQMNNPATGIMGSLNMETSNLLPVPENGVVTWYAASFNYFISNTGSGNAIAGNSFQVRLYKAATPEGLTSAPYSILGTSVLSSSWGEFKNLSLLNPELADLDFWCEPSLYFENGRLYLVLVSFDYDSNGNPIMSNNNVYVFSTTPSGDPASWTWAYNGKLSGQAEASELGGQRLTQIDIVKARDGKLLMVATPDDWNDAENDYNHKGCKIVEVKSLQVPALERDANGKLKVRASITASDANSLGSAASTYDPASETGVLFTRRNKTSTTFTINIWRTGVHP